MAAPSIGVFFLILAGLICTSSALTAKYLIQGTGQSVRTNTPHYLHFHPSTQGTAGQVYQDQTFPKSTAVIDQSLVSSSYTFFSMVESLYFFQMTLGSGGTWTSINAFTLDGNSGTGTLTSGSSTASITYKTDTYVITAAASSLCTASGISGGIYTISSTNGGITHAGMGVDEFGTGDAASAYGYSSYVSSYNSGTKTFTVKSKGYITTSTDKVYLNWFILDGSVRSWCRVRVSTTTWLLLDSLECYDLMTYSPTITGTGTASAVISDAGNWENSYTYAISTNAGNC